MSTNFCENPQNSQKCKMTHDDTKYCKCWVSSGAISCQSCRSWRKQKYVLLPNKTRRVYRRERSFEGLGYVPYTTLTHTHCPLSGSSKQLVCFSVCFRRCALATGPLSGNQISGARLSHHFFKQTSTLTYTLSAAQNFAAREGQFFHLRALLTHLAQRALHPSTLVVQLRRICGLVSPVAKLWVWESLCTKSTANSCLRAERSGSWHL